MSRETWEIVQESGIKNVEIQLALQCAPLIAGLKISNLFQISIEDYIQVLKILKNSRIMIYPLGVKRNTIALLLSGTMGRSSYVSGNGRYMKIQRQSRSFSRNMTIPGKT
mgnify:CR=1 FL=1